MMQSNSVVVFDLDDTLYKEIDFLDSAYREISKEIEERFAVSHVYEQMLEDYYANKDVFQNQVDRLQGRLDKAYLLNRYRAHIPEIKLNQDAITCLSVLKGNNIPIGLITDGRSVTQRNKIQALGLNAWIDNSNIIISEEFGSEKPSERNYRYFEDRFCDCRFFYVGDNVKKDFIAPNRLGWKTICLLDNGKNIHRQDFNCYEGYKPTYQVAILKDVIKYVM